ncbi:methylmalonyl-CoA epimerase [Acidimicrobium ferrooxidans DSM 10331]|uniref:Methylmalonyl-CoA epimerase n=1 Tax=Acidimicrobium ferrooxidans (strain DSM 10331 / JCM 15462 / NBRC 103882 / ICP) TaxID=525909 RepID=C7M1M6_ACIFD|nr:methylmalonyl-CoA epimerase [Acidimicrobium ferrooxidans]ACU53075.1 methylmalonyl-CoA epimerase [Acidimicrobium ferrooxidans DSM 10331]
MDEPEIDHVGIAVDDLDAAIARWEALGARLAHREHVDSDGIEEVMLAVGPSFIQLVAPTREDSPVARFLARRGPGIHHLALRVQSCRDALEEARRQGFDPIDEVPRRGSRGTTVAFVHPRSTGGVLIEFVEEPPATD